MPRPCPVCRPVRPWYSPGIVVLAPDTHKGARNLPGRKKVTSPGLYSPAQGMQTILPFFTRAPVLGHDLAARGALHRAEDPRPLRDIRPGLFFDEELAEWNREDLLDDCGLPFLQTPSPRPGLPSRSSPLPGAQLRPGRDVR